MTQRRVHCPECGGTMKIIAFIEADQGDARRPTLKVVGLHLVHVRDSLSRGYTAARHSPETPMQWLSRHFTRCLIAGFIALLPVAGLVFAIVTLESSISGPWRDSMPFYFPGMGIILAALIIYLIGLTVTTFLGRWMWRRFDLLLDQVPLLGALYQTLKQIVGYGGGKDAIFKQVVLVSNGENEGDELGLVTNEVVDAAGKPMLMVFVPGAPAPTAGRMVIIAPHLVRKVNMKVNDALRCLVAVGATPVPMERVPMSAPNVSS